MRARHLRIGTAGWSIPARTADQFPSRGSSLERYAARFDCAEINSSFHRSHRPGTWRRWASCVPEGFRFSAKLPKEITHKRRLADCSEPLAAALAEMEGMGEKLGILLVQLPPSLALLAGLRVARAAADPARMPAASAPGGWRGLSYFRLHGSPVPYRSSYDDGRLEAYAARLAADTAPVWCIFDNSASSAAAADALKLQRLLTT